MPDILINRRTLLAASAASAASATGLIIPAHEAGLLAAVVF